MRPIAFFKWARTRLAVGAGPLEKTFWLLGGLAFLCATAFRLVADFAPHLAVQAASAEWIGQNLNNAASAVQIVTFVAGIVAALGIVTFGRNPATTILRRTPGAKKSETNLYNELSHLMASGEPSFQRDILRYPSTIKDFEKLSDLNAAAFADSPHYSAEFEAKRTRNVALLQRFDKCFAFVSLGGDDIGFSSVIPLNADAHALYMTGRISDHDFRPFMLPSPTEPPSSLVLFAIGLQPEWEAKRGGRRDLTAINTMIRAHALHVVDLLKHFGRMDLPLVVQAEKQSIIRHIRRFGFKQTKNRGRDGDLLFLSNLASAQMACAMMAKAS